MGGHSRGWIILMALLSAAALFRLYGADWDGGIGAHPDERHVVGVADSLSWPRQWNPFETAPDYAYGHLPVYLLAATRAWAPGGDSLSLGRILAAAFDLGTVAVTFALGRRVHNERIGILAAGFVAFAVLHVQQSHFFTVDGLLALLTSATVLFSIRLVQTSRPAEAWPAGILAGLALGTKASAVLLVLPMSAACALVSEKRGRCLWRIVVTTTVVFALTNPFALIELSVFLQNLRREASILGGSVDVPYTLQYRGSLPYLYPIVQQCRWGLGWLSGCAAFAGLAYAIWRAARYSPRRGEWVALAWTVPSFAYVGALRAKFPRYMLPLTPFLAMYAAYLVWDLAGRRRSLYRVACFLLLGSMLVRCVIFANVYRGPHPWATASDWFYTNVETGAVVAGEEWDHSLPLDATDYEMRELPVFQPETAEKWKDVKGILAEADYLVMASRRAYATLAAMPDRYPWTARYYERLFGGDLGFEPVACFGRFPGLGSVAVADDPTYGLAFNLPEICRGRRSGVLRLGRLDESFVVYDHPQVLVFKATD